MRRNLVQLNTEGDKMQAYLKQLSLKPINLRGTSTVKKDKMPNIEYKAITKLENPYRYERPIRFEQVRSVSELDKKLTTISGSPPNKSTFGKGIQDLNTLSPNVGQAKKTNLNMRLPRLQPTEIDLIASHQKLGQSLQANSVSVTLQSSKKNPKLEPIHHNKFPCYFRTKAGSNGKQTKINQDSVIIDTKLPFGLKLYCVCDGHGLNGHHVSGFIKADYLRENLTKLLRKHQQAPEDIRPILETAFENTNKDLLECSINTDLSGSTVVAVFIYKGKIICVNVGDSRAVLYSHIDKHWKATPLSDDQKPDREDERQRVLKFGGRIEAQKDQNGNPQGPLRVWMANVQMPGLAMTRSFGDKAGIRAGTNGIPEIQQHIITTSDKFMAIASDGIWEYIENEDIMRLIVPLYEKGNMELACDKAVNHATSVWRKVCLSRDDITIILVSLNPYP